jgi:hypothetical protein
MPRTTWRRLVGVALFAGALSCAPPASGAPRDRDGDGLPDSWERTYRFSTQHRSAAGDADRDGLSNLREYRANTNPRRKDTDRDGLRDGVEVKRYKTSPRKKDTDGDGLSDGEEVRRGTNPRKRDTDGDGVRDGAEINAGSDPLAAESVPGAGADPPAPPTGFPSPDDTGVPAGWAPRETRTSDLIVTQPGAVVQDVLLVNADLLIRAPDVTVRRVVLQGGRIDNLSGNDCHNGLLVQDSTLEPPPGRAEGRDSEGAVGVGGYSAERVKIWRRGEGFRVGGRSLGCGPVRIASSFASIVVTDEDCQASHADGIQGYGGPALTVADTTIDFREAGCGTAPFFVPDQQDNTSVVVDGLLLAGGGIPFRLGVTGTVRGLRIVDRSWAFSPVDVKCSMLSSWEAKIVSIDDGFRPTTLREQPCAP